MIPTVSGRQHPKSEGGDERTADDTLRRFASVNAFAFPAFPSTNVFRESDPKRRTACDAGLSLPPSSCNRKREERRSGRQLVAFHH